MNDSDIGELEDYALLEGCEFGEAVEHLINTRSYYCQHLSDEFKTAVDKELQNCLDWFRTNTRIVETKQLTAIRTITKIEEEPVYGSVRELEYID